MLNLVEQKDVDPQNGKGKKAGTRRFPPVLIGLVGLGVFLVLVGVLCLVVSFLIVNKLKIKQPTMITAIAMQGTNAPSPEKTPALDIGSTWVSPKDSMVMIYVPAGEFLMGSTEADIEKILAACSDCQREYLTDELPQHKVYLDAFWIDKTEVTFGMYALCLAAGACPPLAATSFDTRPYNDSKYADYPVINLSWDHADAYCKWAGERLPTEAEWEKAARGMDGRTYPWGEGIDCSLANYQGKDGEDCVGDTQPVGSYLKGTSPYGALDMSGNVLEFVADWYSATYYASSPAENPLGPSNGTERMLRGGDYDTNDWRVRVSLRAKEEPNLAGTVYGFRCALTRP
jgi:formylglycine-generating enzyme required for sulfatase activity